MRPLLFILLLGSQLAGAGPNIWIEPHSGIAFVLLPEGCYQMGTGTEDDNLVGNRSSVAVDEYPLHEVCLDAFWMGQFEVQHHQWQRVMGTGGNEKTAKVPVANISWQQVQQFVDKLNQLADGKQQYRLPTEAEWEYACRAGQSTDATPEGGSHISVAWYSTSPYRIMQPSEVGQLEPNAWGLYDMLGNLWEWTQDSYQADGYRQHQLFNPIVASAQSSERVIRGASFRSEDLQVRCANRSNYNPFDSLQQIGFRLVRSR